ncbi:MAG: hypothetical protein LBU04_03905 [Christensenellaceae bacterium]|jgi:dipicolinate synthase subunit A|nr:hypothetical protein [Christensenellaceae bacterium]
MVEKKNSVILVEIKDRRDEFLLKELIKDGYRAVDIKDATHEIDGFKIYVLSITTNPRRENIELFDKGSMFFSSTLKHVTGDTIKEFKLTHYDYFANEELAVRNAGLTAEGMLALLIENTQASIKDLKILILGYGRVGKASAQILHDNHCFFSVVNRNSIASAEATLIANRSYSFENMPNIIRDYDVIINSVPAVILNSEILHEIKDDTLILDLASLPGGVDMSQLENRNIKVIHALGLPGKFSPLKAAKLIKKVITDKLNSM